MTERIEAAAILFRGNVVTLPRPARHDTIIIATAATVPPSEWPVCGPGDQGFVTDAGRYVGREDAYWIARAAGQVDRVMSPGWLFSEDLW